MNGGYPSVGTHVLVNVYTIPSSKHFLLTHLDTGLPYLDEIVQRMNLHVVSQTGYQFQPQGYTYAFVLSESHFTIHTYPEHQSCYIDVFCCSPSFRSDELIRLVMELFGTEDVRYQVLTR
jgi:S-adenosylmethionine decarboxylase proenzyme